MQNGSNNVKTSLLIVKTDVEIIKNMTIYLNVAYSIEIVSALQLNTRKIY